MLARKNRLKSKKDFDQVFKKGKSFKEDFLVLKIKCGESEPMESRFGFIISKKVSKKAVIRNKIKRMLGEAVRLKMDRLKRGADIILITLPGIEKKDSREINKNIDKLFKKSDICKN